MKPFHAFLIAAITMPTGCSSVHTARDKARDLATYEKEKAAIYAHMKRYGINRDSVADLDRIRKESPSDILPRVKIASEKVLQPGEHYRVEMDDLILTMRIPDAPPMPGNWIWPYTSLRNPDNMTLIDLEHRQGAVHLAELGWYTCNSIFPPGFFGRCEVMASTITYAILKPEQLEHYSSPEKLRQLMERTQKRSLPSTDQIEASRRGETIIYYAGTRIDREPETLVINGRVWVRESMIREGIKKSFVYVTTITPDRMVSVYFGTPRHDYNSNPDPSTYPSNLKRAFAHMEEMVASLRIAKINDDGTPDPFVIERVEPAPLPVREKLPAAESQ